MRAKTVGFAIADEDRALLETLVNKYGNGNRSEFLRVAMKTMARLEFAERFDALRGDLRAEMAGKVYSPDEIEGLIREVKAKSIDS